MLEADFNSPKESPRNWLPYSAISLMMRFLKICFSQMVKPHEYANALSPNPSGLLLEG